MQEHSFLGKVEEHFSVSQSFITVYMPGKTSLKYSHLQGKERQVIPKIQPSTGKDNKRRNKCILPERSAGEI